MNGFFVTNELDKYDEAIKQGMAGVLCSDEELAKEIVEAMYAAKSKQDNSEVEEYIGNLRVLLDDLGEELDHLEVALADENGELDDGEGEYGLCGGCSWLDEDEDEDEDEYDEDEYDECRAHSSFEDCVECNEWKCPYYGR